MEIVEDLVNMGFKAVAFSGVVASLLSINHFSKYQKKLIDGVIQITSLTIDSKLEGERAEYFA